MPPQGSPVELTLLTRAQVSQPQECEDENVPPTLTCHMKARVQEGCPPSMPEASGKVGPKVISVGELPLPLPDSTLRRGPDPGPGQRNSLPCWQRCGCVGSEIVSMGELYPLLVCCAVVYIRERSPSFFLAPHCLQQMGKLTILLTICSTQESRPCSSFGQHSRANPVGKRSR